MNRRRVVYLARRVEAGHLTCFGCRVEGGGRQSKSQLTPVANCGLVALMANEFYVDELYTPRARCQKAERTEREALHRLAVVASAAVTANSQ